MTAPWRRYLRFWGAKVDDDVDQEFEFHVEMRVRDYVARGLSEREARDAAERRFGHRGRIRNSCLTIGHRSQRRMNRAQTVDALLQDVRYGVRALGRQKGWTVVALLTMALGIGASTAMFSAVNSLVLNPLPYRAANRVVMVWRVEPKSGVMIPPGKEMLDAWKAQTKVFEGIQQFGTNAVTLTGRGDPASLSAGMVDADFPAFAGVGLIAGRSFLPEEMVPGGRRVAVISEQLWQERFAGNARALGERLMLNDKPYTIVGVAPSRLRLPMLDRDGTDVWLPQVKDSTYFGGMVLARLRPGLSLADASKQLSAVVTNDALDASEGLSKYTVRLVRPGDLIGFKNSLFLLSGAVGLLMLVACANIAHLLLARSATRERELAIRTALGAGRWRLARQLLTESTLLAVIGCIAGVVVGYAGVRAIAALRPESLHALALTRVDGRALLVALGLSAFAGIAFGCTAALHAVRRTTSDALRATASGTSAPRTHRLRSLLVVTEMAVSAMLLVGAALLIRSVIKLQHVETGFDSRNLYAMNLNLARDRYPSATERAAFIARVVQSAQHLPGVVSVTRAAATPPHLGGFMIAPLEVEGEHAAPASATMAMNFVAPGYFAALGIQLQGSTFGPASVAAKEVIVNRGFAAKYWAGESAIGKRFRFKSGKQTAADDWFRIIGVADDVPTRGLAGDRGEPFMYQPADPEKAQSQTTIAVRVKDGVNPVTALRQIVASMDARLIPPPVTTVDADLAKTIATQRFTMILLAIFAALAVVLSAIGLYGVISYVVTQRTREIGIRVALGATPANVARAIVVRGLALSVIGLVVGLTAAVWGTSLIKTALFGVQGTDVASYASSAAALLVVSVLACAVPMRRAMRVDPVIAMRGD